MKRVIFGLLVMLGLVCQAFAGTEIYSNKNTQSVARECPQWYADNEFNLSLSGVYAMTGNSWRDDLYLGVDHSWGGAIDAKYFFHRYFGLGVQGTLLSVNDNETFDNGFVRSRTGNDDRHLVGSALGTITLRFPMNCSRFAPYVWAGGGGIFGGGRTHDFVLDSTQPLGILRRDFNKSESKSMAQVGGGFEVRVTPHCGIITDFSWNIVSGAHNNFGMARTGVNFSF
jgi:Outer membrane protein beta-barrel domain